MKTKTPMRATTLPLALALALAGAGACGEPPSEEETTETNPLTAEEAAALDEVTEKAAAITCVGMRNGSIKRTRIPGQWTGIVDNGCNRSVRVNLDIAANPDPGCRTYAARTSHNVKWWAGVATSGFRKVYECD